MTGIAVILWQKNMEVLVNEIIPFLPPYGPFELRLIVKHIKSPAEHTLANSPEGLFDIERYMVENGFAIERRDMQDDESEYLELTDMGRQLKMSGSIIANDLRVRREIEASVHRKKQEENFYWINFWIALGTCTAAIYYLLEILNRFLHFYH